VAGVSPAPAPNTDRWECAVAPSEHEVKVAIDQLNTFANRWKVLSDKADQARSATNGIALTNYDLTWIGGATTKTYSEFLSLTQRRLDGARGTFTWLKGQLTNAASEYDADERNAVHRMTNTW
jgi:hypothetical protein